MNEKLKRFMQNLSDEQLAAISESDIDMDSDMDDETAGRIFKRTASALGICQKGIALKRKSKDRRRMPIWSKIAAIAACIVVTVSVSFTVVMATNESFRKSVFDILEYWGLHPEEKAKITDTDYKSDLKEKAKKEPGITEQTAQPEHIEYPIAEVVNFRDFDYDFVNLITVNNAITGETIRITDVDAIEQIVAFLKNISGSSPVSNRGYYGGYYDMKVFKDDREYLHVGFSEGPSGEGVFTYGTFETVNGFRYACRYEMNGVEKEELLAFFSGFFS